MQVAQDACPLGVPLPSDVLAGVLCRDSERDRSADERDSRQQLFDHARLTRFESLRVVGVEEQGADSVAGDEQRVLDGAGRDLGAVLTEHQHHVRLAGRGGDHLCGLRK